MWALKLTEIRITGGYGSTADPSTDEKILGEIIAFARLAIGLERLRLIFTGERMIVAHVGKRGGSAAPFSSLAGFLAAGLEDLFKGGRESVTKKTKKTDSIEKILRIDKDNFSIRYRDIVRVELDEYEGRMRIMVLSKDDKFQFISGTSAERLREIVGNALGAKLSTRRAVQ